MARQNYNGAILSLGLRNYVTLWMLRDEEHDQPCRSTPDRVNTDP